MDLLIAQGRAMAPRPCHAVVFTDLKEQSEFLIEELIIVLEIKTEERIGLRERSAPCDDLRPSVRNQIKCGEFLKDTDGVGGTQHRDGTGEPYSFGAGSGGRKQDDRSRIEELLTMMLPYSEDIQPDTIGQLHLFQQIPKADDRVDQRSRDGIGQRGDKAIESDLHRSLMRFFCQ